MARSRSSMPGISTRIRSLPAFSMTVSETPSPSIRVRTTLSARSIASLLSATTPLESSTSSARCIPPDRSRPFRSGTRYVVVSKKVPSARRWRTFTFRGKSAHAETRTRTPINAKRHFRLDMRLRGGGRYVRGTIKVIRLGESRQRATGRLGVPAQLGDQRIRVGKAHRVAQACDERHVYPVAIEVALRVEQVRLEGAPLVAEGRSAAEIHHTIESPPRSNDLYGVDTVRGQQLARVPRLDVEGGESQQPSPRLSGHDLSLHGIPTAEEAPGALQRSGSHRTAYERAAHRLARVGEYGRHGVNRETARVA